MDFRVPELGEGIEVATVVRVLVTPGAAVAKGQEVVEVETEKATMPIPTDDAGTVDQILVKPGDKVKIGAVLMTFKDGAASPSKPAKASAVAAAIVAQPRLPVPAIPTAPREPVAPLVPNRNGDARIPVPASPATRRLTRELGVDLRHVAGSAAAGRVTQDDVKTYVRALLKPQPGMPAPAVPPLPDFANWGAIEKKPFTGLRKAIARNLTLSWTVAPQVTQHDLADITDLEERRKKLVEASLKGAPKVTMTVLAVKACVAALKAFPQFNSSYDANSGEYGELILKKYYHIGIAVNTERGLVVPVIRDADAKSIPALAKEIGELAEKARAGKLVPDEMRGGTFTITNLGGIGGTAFSPIINYPEVAILGLSRSALQPIVRNGEVVPRLMLPLSLTYDHRVIDGAAGARFCSLLVETFSAHGGGLFEG